MTLCRQHSLPDLAANPTLPVSYSLEGRLDTNSAILSLTLGLPALPRMNEEPTTAAIQRCIDALQGDQGAEPLIRALLARAVQRRAQRNRTAEFYPRLAQPLLEPGAKDELLDGVVAGLITALQKVQPQTVRQFFGLANQHMRWQLNDLARLLDSRPSLDRVLESGVLAPPQSSDSCLSQDARRMLMAIEGLPPQDREVFELSAVCDCSTPRPPLWSGFR